MRVAAHLSWKMPFWSNCKLCAMLLRHATSGISQLFCGTSTNSTPGFYRLDAYCSPYLFDA